MTKTKRCVCAAVEICHNSEDTGLTISAALPGVRKQDIVLEVAEDNFCIAGERENLQYDCCYPLTHYVDGKKSEATFENGLLVVNVPFLEEPRGKKIQIH